MRKILLIIVFLFLVSLSFAEQENLGGKTMNIETAAEQLFFVTVRIEVEKVGDSGNIEKGIGTGFIINYKWGDKEGLFLVTNKHVIKGAKKGRFFFIQSDGKNPILGKTYTIEFDNFEKLWYGHPDNRIDVAVMPLITVLKQIEQRKGLVFFRSLSKELMPTPAIEESFDAIEEVVFVGYPSGIYDTENDIPVMRKGITATPININYLKLPEFLIDASVFPGSSGSPVFILNKGSFSTRKGGLTIGSRLVFLGLISSVYTRNKDGIWDFIEVPTTITPVIKVRQMINLGVVIKSSTVFEAVEALINSEEKVNDNKAK